MYLSVSNLISLFHVPVNKLLAPPWINEVLAEVQSDVFNVSNNNPSLSVVSDLSFCVLEDLSVTKTNGFIPWLPQAVCKVSDKLV